VSVAGGEGFAKTPELDSKNFFAPKGRVSVAGGEGFAKPPELDPVFVLAPKGRPKSEFAMSQSFDAMYVHLIFSTKHRLPTIRPAWVERMYEYIGGIVANRQGKLITAGGMPEHIHLLVSLGRKWSMADLLRDVKAGSSKWVHDNFAEAHDFGWQDGYGAFSVSASKLAAVKRYIADQPRHHQALSFQDELLTLLCKHGLTWDERYIWD
jgi:REP element-mobilizing transposase RayT